MTADKDAGTGSRHCGSPERSNVPFAILSLLVMLLIIYGNSFYGEWHFDDYHNIVDNPNVRLQNLTWRDIRATFYGVSDGSDVSHITRPLAFLSFGLNYFFGGTDVFGYHAVNFVIHWAAAVFLFLFVYETLRLPLLCGRYGDRAYGIALLASVLWATSPVQVHAVAVIVQRMASLAGLGTIMALYFYLRTRTAHGKRARWAFASLCAAAALLAFGSKENAAMLPVSILLYDVLLIRGASRETWLRLRKYAWIPLAAALFLAWLFSDFLPGIFQAYQVRPFTMAERLLTAPRVLIFYVTLLLYPIPSRLALLHDITVSTSLLDPWTTLPALMAVAIVCAAAVLMARKRPLPAFCVLFFFLNHLIEGTLIPLELIFEHRNYIPSMFFFVPLSVLMIRCLDYFAYRRGIQAFMAGGFALLLAFQAHTTFERNDIVRSDLHLWLDNVQKAPDLSRPRINLAKHYYEAGLYEDAYREFRKAEELNRDTNLRQVGVASYGLGIYYLYQAKDVKRAEQQFARALERFPGYPPAVAGLAKARLKKGDVEGAWEWMRAWLPRCMNNVEMLNCAALVLLKQGNARGALKLAARSLELKWNDPQPWELSGEAWRMLGQWEKAAQCWEEALRLNPLNPRAILALLDIRDRLRDERACALLAARCLVLKGDASLEEWLGGLARNAGETAYEVKAGRLAELIRKAVRRELTPGKS